MLDCHSVPGAALPCEQAEAGKPRPDICIGTDAFQTPPALGEAFCAAYRHTGWQVALNGLFVGASVLSSRFRQDARVSAVMFEANRRLDLSEQYAAPLAEFGAIARRVKQCRTDSAAEFVRQENRHE